MKQVIERLRVFFSISNSPSTADAFSISFIKSRKEIRKILTHSKENGRVVGVYSSALGEGMFLAGVEDLYTMHGEETVIFRPYDIHGVLLQRNSLALSEIRAVSPMPIVYQNPILKETTVS